MSPNNTEILASTTNWISVHSAILRNVDAEVNAFERSVKKQQQ